MRSIYNLIISGHPCQVFVFNEPVVKTEVVDGKIRLLCSDIDGRGPGWYVLERYAKKAIIHIEEFVGSNARKHLERHGFVFNTATALYARNGISLTEEEAAYACDIFGAAINTTYWSGIASETNIRTTPAILSRPSRSGGVRIFSEGAFYNCMKIEVVDFGSSKWPGSNYFIIEKASMMFAGCSELREVTDRILFSSGASNQNAFAGCEKLEMIYLYRLGTNAGLADSPLLKIEALEYLVKWVNPNISSITVTVHPEVYDKLTDQTEYPQWYALNMEARSKKIAFATI